MYRNNLLKNNKSKGNNSNIIVIVIICFVILFSIGIISWMYFDNNDDESSPSPSPVNCVVRWSESSWKPCDKDTCENAKGSEYLMYHYRTGAITQAAKHGGRECPELLEFKVVHSNINSQSASGSATSSPSTSSSAATSSPSASGLATSSTSAIGLSTSSPSPIAPPEVPIEIYDPTRLYPRHNNSEDNYYNYCNWGVKQGWCANQDFVKKYCGNDCRPIELYDSTRTYPVHNNSSDNYYNYCKWGVNQGWCDNGQFKNVYCKDNCI